MRGLIMTFSDGGGSINFNKVGDEYELLQLRALNYIATKVGSDKLFPNKGTDLLRRGVTNVIYDEASAKQETAFISNDTQNFITTQQDVESADPLNTLELTPRFKNLQAIEIATKFEFNSGKILSSETTLII